MRNVFGRVRLGYLTIESSRFADWRRFGSEAIGMHHDDVLPGVLRFRLDDHACRFLVQRGPADDVTAIGWQADDDATFDAIVGRLRAHGVPVASGADEEAELRGVARFVRFPGPNGLGQELFTTATLASAPVLACGGGFVTGESGLGHVALTSKKPHRMHAYFDTVFDARLSDFIDERINGMRVKIRFLRVNQRHHSVAIAAVNRLPVNPIRTRVQHLNVQVATLDDLTASYERIRALGFDIALDVGQHTNDRELSYYAVTPSGFEWEVGWNPIVVDEDTWEPTTHQGISIWGHTQQDQSVHGRLKQLATATRSVVRREDDLGFRRIPCPA